MNATTALVNDAAERTVLAVALVDQDRLHIILPRLQASDFSTSAYRLTYAAIVRLAEKGKAVEVMTVSTDLAERNELQKVGGVAFLSGLTEGITSGLARSMNVEQYIEFVEDKSRRRQARAAAEALIARAEDPSVATDECLRALGETLLELEGASSRTEARPMKDVMRDTLAELDRQAATEGLAGFRTGLPSLDLATGGLRPGELWTLGALPGRGKTAFVAELLQANAEAGEPVCMFSLEMQDVEVAKRLIAAQANIPAFKLRNPRSIGKDAWLKLTRAAGELAELPFYIDPSPSLKLQELIARMRLYVRRHKTRLFVVDYNKFVEGKGRDVRERFGAVADGLRVLAKQESVAVLLLSQLRRPDGGVNARPDMLQLKETGDLEAHSHCVLLIFMPTAEDGNLLVNSAEIIIGKNRYGCPGALPVYYDTKSLRFYDRRANEDATEGGGPS